MGLYINPPEEPKEVWLANNAVMIDPPSELPDDSTLVLICWVNNGPFSAAGVAFDQNELDHMLSSDDPRPKQWFLIDRDKLTDDVAPKADRYLK